MKNKPISIIFILWMTVLFEAVTSLTPSSAPGTPDSGGTTPDSGQAQHSSLQCYSCDSWGLDKPGTKTCHLPQSSLSSVETPRMPCRFSNDSCWEFSSRSNGVTTRVRRSCFNIRKCTEKYRTGVCDSLNGERRCFRCCDQPDCNSLPIITQHSSAFRFNMAAGMVGIFTMFAHVILI